MSELKDLALKNIGRNVLYFQKFEGMLKLLLSQNNFRSPMAKIDESLEARKTKFENLSLGILTKEYFKSISKNGEDMYDYPEDIDEPWISFSFSIEHGEDILAQQKAAFKFLVNERNRLIHQMLIKFDPDSFESCEALLNELEKQHIMIGKEYKKLQSILKGFYEARKKLLTEFISENNNSKNNK